MTATVEAGTPRAMAARALGSADQFLGVAQRLLPGIADTLRGGPDAAALGELSRLLDGVLSLARLSADIGKIVPIAAEPVEIDVVRDLTTELVANQERGDWNGLASLLVDRMVPRMAEWQDRFEAIAEKI